MLNLGGPKTPEDVKPFLSQLFADRDIVRLPFQPILGPLIAALRTPKVTGYYKEIGGSPIQYYI
jgi:ferrochelatase